MDAVWMLFLAAFGACTGSFVNVVVHRMPRGQSIVFPGSHCPACGKPIRWYDNIPLLSWLVLRGRCRACRSPISPRYLLVEAATAAIFAGIYACYFLLDVRDGAGNILTSWPMYVAHVALLAGLLACSLVDIEHWIVPLEVCWFVSLAGLAAQTYDPHPFVPLVPPSVGAMALGGAAGLAVALLLQRYGLIQRSFLDAADKPPPPAEGRPAKGRIKPRQADKQPVSVAFTKAHGVNPRREIIRELFFLAPAIVLAAAAYVLATKVGPVRSAWHVLTCPAEECGGAFARHFNGFLAALSGYLVGGLWIWGMRIMGTLAFGKEAMGLGDVHILAAVGAVNGWIVPSIAFFVAPLFGLLWAVYLWLRRNQRELPYGPWLALASAVVMLFYDGIVGFLGPYLGVLVGPAR